MSTEVVELTVVEEKPQFHVTDKKSAEWVVEQLALLQFRIDTLTAQRNTEIASLKADKAHLEKLYLAELEQWALQAIAGGGKKSLHLGYGTVKLTHCNPAIRISDPEAALQWAIEDAPQCVRTTQSLDGDGLRELAEQYLQRHGELIPGVELTQERESFSIAFPKLAKPATEE